jgi:hypothetical protein
VNAKLYSEVHRTVHQVLQPNAHGNGLENEMFLCFFRLHNSIGRRENQIKSDGLESPRKCTRTHRAIVHVDEN